MTSKRLYDTVLQSVTESIAFKELKGDINSSPSPSLSLLRFIPSPQIILPIAAATDINPHLINPSINKFASDHTNNASLVSPERRSWCIILHFHGNGIQKKLLMILSCHWSHIKAHSVSLTGLFDQHMVVAPSIFFQSQATFNAFLPLSCRCLQLARPDV